MIIIERFNHPQGLPNHQIHFGISTWTQDEEVIDQTQSIRRAVYNDGRFSPHGSSEIPMEDMGLLTRLCVARDLLDINELTLIQNEITESIRRQTINP
jgi:hypothetical protein